MRCFRAIVTSKHTLTNISPQGKLHRSILVLRLKYTTDERRLARESACRGVGNWNFFKKGYHSPPLWQADSLASRLS
jgi:hypothetical protein